MMRRGGTVRLPNDGTVQTPTTRYSSGADPGSVGVPDNTSAFLGCVLLRHTFLL